MDTWTITHSLPYRPNVTFIDSTGREVEGDVEWPDATTIIAHFTLPFGGQAILS